MQNIERDPPTYFVIAYETRSGELGYWYNIRAERVEVLVEELKNYPYSMRNIRYYVQPEAMDSMEAAQYINRIETSWRTFTYEDWGREIFSSTTMPVIGHYEQRADGKLRAIFLGECLPIEGTVTNPDRGADEPLKEEGDE